jgi:hypothetical protein
MGPDMAAAAPLRLTTHRRTHGPTPPPGGPSRPVIRRHGRQARTLPAAWVRPPRSSRPPTAASAQRPAPAGLASPSGDACAVRTRSRLRRCQQGRRIRSWFAGSIGRPARSRRAIKEKVGIQNASVGKWFDSLLGHIMIMVWPAKTSMGELFVARRQRESAQVRSMGVQVGSRSRICSGTP